MSLISPMAGMNPPVLVVTGEGRTDVVPDVVVLSLGVTTRAQQAATAFQQTAAALSRVVSALRAAGVPQEQIQTTQVSLQPIVENGRQIGFDATATVRVTLRDPSAVGALIDRAVAAGANNVAGISFEVRDPSAAEAAALSLAVQAAQRQAVVLARSLGIALGPVLRVEAEPAGGPVTPLFARAVAAEAVPVLPGTIEVTRRVRVEFLVGR
ncbi:MAG TPA: SIMPL domain-containing protein [Symbiobacteriaceae bacterium]|nr:SIMPL domain-containing protein [Symbiobacteriaceae bacterium]